MSERGADSLYRARFALARSRTADPRNGLVASRSSRTIIRHAMKSLISLILIPTVLVASVVSAYVRAEPVKADPATPNSAPADVPTAPVSDDSDASAAPRGEEPSDERKESTTTAPPPIGLTPRTDSVEALERSLRAPAGSKVSTRFEPVLSGRVRTHHKPPRLDQLISRTRCVATSLRFVASRLRSHAPPVR